MPESIIISLGGSLIVPDEIDIEFLQSFKSLILKQMERGKRFVLITGGGKTSRKYTEAAKNLVMPTNDDLDWIGIGATRLNAELIRVLLGEFAHSSIVMDPNTIPPTDKPVMVGGGWKPGNSSDLAAVQAALATGSKKIINLSNTDYVYDSDPKLNPEAKKIEQLSWKEYKGLVPAEWKPGSNYPFDPIAAKVAEENSLTVIIMNGKPIENLAKFLRGEKFQGTIIT